MSPGARRGAITASFPEGETEARWSGDLFRVAREVRRLLSSLPGHPVAMPRAAPARCLSFSRAAMSAARLDYKLCKRSGLGGLRMRAVGGCCQLRERGGARARGGGAAKMAARRAAGAGGGGGRGAVGR